MPTTANKHYSLAMLLPTVDRWNIKCKQKCYSPFPSCNADSGQHKNDLDNFVNLDGALKNKTQAATHTVLISLTFIHAILCNRYCMEVLDLHTTSKQTDILCSKTGAACSACSMQGISRIMKPVQIPYEWYIKSTRTHMGVHARTRTHTHTHTHTPHTLSLHGKIRFKLLILNWNAINFPSQKENVELARAFGKATCHVLLILLCKIHV